MKFARYLEETQVPEWKKAYIDYRGLKKKIAAIRKGQQTWDDPQSPREPRSDMDSIRRRPELVPRRSTRLRQGTLMTRVHTFRSAVNKSPVVSLAELIPTLNPLQKRFFARLDLELDKVESFYLDREKEAKLRFIALKQQLAELQDHRRLFLETRTNDQFQWLPFSLKTRNVDSNVRSQTHKISPRTDEGKPDSPRASIATSEAQHIHLDPDDYLHARKKLKKALLEFYRMLEVLQNYRTLNLIGFRKALKKFEKITLISALEAYIREKVEPSTFSSTKAVAEMFRDTENLFTSRFARGDKKRALARLRVGSKHKNHHFASFRTGIALGLAIPAFATGLYYSFDEHTRQEIPAWGGLLLIYGIIFVPVLFSLLVGVNILVWHTARINYVFIFELDVKTKLDYQEYFEIPAILLSTLCYAFCLSFARIGVVSVAPTTWPLIWLALCASLIANPLPIYHRSSRSWLFRIFGRLLLPVRRVEFADFWMGDQFCSLVFSLSNLYFFGCTYVGGFNESWRGCTSKPQHWGITLALAILPFLARLIQSIKRWYDSRLIAHLINGGKYAFGIITYSFYYNWRHHEGQHSGTSFALYCFFSICYSTYACTWDFLVDWSVFKVHAKYPLLRDELIGSNYIPLYYIAIVTNVLIRFAWVLYIPAAGPDFLLRTFIVGMLEMLRRWQWNFYRLENEHIGNIDQYRATREVPLPYSFEGAAHDSDEGDEDDRRSFSSFFRSASSLNRS